MKKVISLALALVMMLSIFAVMPTANATETVYKAGSEVQAVWKFPNADAFTAIEFRLYYGESLELVEGSAFFPHATTQKINEKIAERKIVATVSENGTYEKGVYCDISSDHVMFTVNFKVLEDCSALDLTLEFDPDETFYLTINGKDMYHPVDSTNEWSYVIVSEPEEPTTTPAETESSSVAPTETVTESVSESIQEDATTATTPEEPASSTPEEPELKNGIVEEDGELYYYKDGAKFYAGLINIDGYYYYVNSSCKVITGRAYWISKHNYLLPYDVYQFGDDGKMLNPPVEETTESVDDGGVKNGIVKEDGTLYYYKDGAKFYAGLIIIDGDYYYVNSSCVVVAAKAYYISKNNRLLPCGTYTFDVNGKMMNPPVEESTTEDPSVVKDGFVKENGITYYYVNGVKKYVGLIKIDGYYYYVNSSCEVITDRSYFISKNNDLLPCAAYTFDFDGKMVNPPAVEPETEQDPSVVKNGFVKENGITYYYENGEKVYAGLMHIGDYYYYVNSSRVVVTGKAYYISKTNNLLPVGSYYFDAEGRMCDAKTKEPIIFSITEYIPL